MEAGLWVLALAVFLLGFDRWRGAEPDVPAPPSALQATPPEPRIVPRERLAAAGRTITGGNPFRLDRAPAPIPFAQPGMTGMGGMMPGMPPPYVPPPPPRPPLAVTGIVGPPWQAVLEGLPDQPGPVVVRRGDVFGDLRIRDVTRTTVVVSAPDTTWRLTVRTWQ